MTVDVEDYFQVSAFESIVSRDQWDEAPHRVESNTVRILDLFASKEVSATFFVLGWVAERYPKLVKRMAAEGHEVASHGYSHARVPNLSAAEFREEVRRTKGLLEDLGQTPVTGYRAPSYSIDRDHLWAIDVLQETGHRYSSSIYPIHHDLYGIPDAPRFAFHHNGGGLLEIPITTMRLMSVNWPCGGGGYFRLWPYRVSRWAMRQVHRSDRQPCVFYFHPWEIDPDQPRQERLGFRTRFRHYLNLTRMKARVECLLEDFRWARMDQVFSPLMT
jgi:polysaccharide deacetylase family protein (PEP-CTERM system associated)